MSLDAMLLKEAIADAKARRQTELAWCKCPEDCLCDHCKPIKLKLALSQVQAICSEKRILKLLENGRYEMRNQTHTLSRKTLASVIRKLAAELKDDLDAFYD